MPTAIKDDLQRMKGRGPKNKVYATVIGEKRRLKITRDDGTWYWSKLVPMEEFTPSFVVYTIGVGYAKGTGQDTEAILTFWRANEKAPKTYEWAEGGKPPLKIPKEIQTHQGAD